MAKALNITLPVVLDPGQHYLFSDTFAKSRLIDDIKHMIKTKSLYVLKSSPACMSHITLGDTLGVAINLDVKQNLSIELTFFKVAVNHKKQREKFLLTKQYLQTAKLKLTGMNDYTISEDPTLNFKLSCVSLSFDHK